MKQTGSGTPPRAPVFRLLRRPGHLARRAIAILRARFALRQAEVASRVGASGRLVADIRGTCTIASHVSFRGGAIPTHLRVHPGAELSVGAYTVLNYGVAIEVVEHVRIGARCMIASMVSISDRGWDGPGPIVIGDDVWLAHGAIIEAGVTIGDGAVVSAGSVVSSNVPPGHLASGNPARAVPLALLTREPLRATGLRSPR